MTNLINKTIPSSTVLIIRDGVSGLEVFMVVRHHQIDFAAGALVFPGGKVDKSDYDKKLNQHLCEEETSDRENIPFKIAAIRECFEEANVLFALCAFLILANISDNESLNDIIFSPYQLDLTTPGSKPAIDNSLSLILERPNFLYVPLLRPVSSHRLRTLAFALSLGRSFNFVCNLNRSSIDKFFCIIFFFNA